LKTLDQNADFEALVLPHLDAAYNLARWLAGNDHDAEDIAQEATLRAFRFLHNFRGANSRAWLLTIVRNTAYTWFKQNRPGAVVNIANEELLEIEDSAAPGGDSAMLRASDLTVVKSALEELPVLFREALVLREVEGLSYKEIADIADVPIGTVMSRLGRARRLFQQIVKQKEQK
jgi:RNA polymerase sigma-70 factor (ECF subfamily)